MISEERDLCRAQRMLRENLLCQSLQRSIRCLSTRLQSSFSPQALRFTNSSPACTLMYLLSSIYINDFLCVFLILYTCHQAVSVEQNCVLHFVIFIIEWNRTLRIHSRLHTRRKTTVFRLPDSASNQQYGPNDVSSSPPQISAATINER